MVDAREGADDVVGFCGDDEILDHVLVVLRLFGGDVGWEDFDPEVGSGFRNAICDARNLASF